MSVNSSDNTFLGKGDLIEVSCIDIDVKGNGVSKHYDQVIVTPNLLPGDKAFIEITYKQQKIWFSRINKLITASPTRILPKCRIFSDCGGCSLQHINYQSQIKLKTKSLRETLKRIGNIDAPINKAITSLYDGFNYRNKTVIPLYRKDQSELKMGYYKIGTNEIVNMDTCIVLDSRISSKLLFLKNELGNLNVRFNNNNKSLARIKYLLIRLGYNTGQILLSIISDSRITCELESFVSNVTNNYPDIITITNNVNTNKSNNVLGKLTYILSGNGYIYEKLCNLKFIISTTSFFQVNTIQAEKIVNFIIRNHNFSCSTSNIIDAYCGIGTISLPLATISKKVIGIELCQTSIDTARINAQINNLSNIDFISGDVAIQLSNYLSRDHVLVLDPPRKGLNPEVINTIIDRLPTKIFYLSCNPSTLSRDLKSLLRNNNYNIKTIQPVDFFPQTNHLEVLVILERII